MNVLSVFDGMACGMLAMQRAGIEVERYVAYEIDKYAVQTSSHNFPMIEHRGDVFKADFTEFEGFDFVLAGFPCTKFSIAQKNDRETKPYSGEGWDLFEQAWRAVCEAKPKYFLFENNKSMAKAVQQEISKIVGFEPICINSALVSAQNRQRLYWVGKRNEDGTYSKVPIEQPEDLGILLKDVLECGSGKVLTEREVDYMFRKEGRTEYGYIQKSTEEKSKCITANIAKGVPYNVLFEICAEPVNMTSDGKAQCLRATCYKDGIRNMVGNTTDRKTCVAEPIRVGTWPNNAKNQAHDSQQYRIYSPDGKGVTLCGNGGGMGAKTGLYAIPLETEIVPFVEERLCNAVEKYGYIPPMWNPYNNAEITDKAPTQTAQCASQTKSSTVLIFDYATPCEWDEEGKPVKAVSVADSKIYTVYEVKDGHITIKGKTYPIKLADGFYIIRKLTVRECMRLQTVPEWYEFPVSDSQAYKMLGNGWTVDVIAHLLKGCIKTNERN